MFVAVGFFLVGCELELPTSWGEQASRCRLSSCNAWAANVFLRVLKVLAGRFLWQRGVWTFTLWLSLCQSVWSHRHAGSPCEDTRTAENQKRLRGGDPGTERPGGEGRRSGGEGQKEGGEQGFPHNS